VCTTSVLHPHAAGGIVDNNTSASRAQIAALSTMKDSQRLALLKEVGGTKIYEERRHDSLKLMAESEGRSQRIQEVVRRAPVHRVHLDIHGQLHAHRVCPASDLKRVCC